MYEFIENSFKCLAKRISEIFFKNFNYEIFIAKVFFIRSQQFAIFSDEIKQRDREEFDK